MDLLRPLQRLPSTLPAPPELHLHVVRKSIQPPTLAIADSEERWRTYWLLYQKTSPNASLYKWSQNPKGGEMRNVSGEDGGVHECIAERDWLLLLG